AFRLTAMGYLTRSSRRANSQPAKTAKQRKLLEPKSRPKRADSAHSGNAPLSEHEKSRETAWEDPPVARARPTEADADSTKDKNPIYTMKPIGQYPSPAEYKSVGLKPPPKHVRKVARWVADTDEEDEDFMTDTPITPTAEDTMVSGVSRVDKRDDRFSGGVNPVALKSSIEKIVGRDLGVNANGVNDEVNGDADKTNLATPVSESFDLHLLPPSTTHPSLSPAETPVQTPDEITTDPILPVSDSLLSAPDPVTPLNQTQSPPATTIADASMASEAIKSTGLNLVALLNSVEQPTSDVFDVPQLKKVITTAVSHSKEIGDEEVALSLVYFWSDVKDDEFKMALIHNIGVEPANPILELALRTTLRHSVTEARQWYQDINANSAVRAKCHSNYESDSGSSLSSAKSVVAEPGKSSFKVSDIYRDTSGPKLEESFVNGKTNTAPYKRPKKPVRVHENSFKRRYEWENDPTMSEIIRTKRARFAKDAPSEEVPAMPSSIRPDLPGSEIQSVNPVEEDIDVPPADISPRSKRMQDRQNKQEKGKKQGKGKGPQKGKTKSKSPSDAPTQSSFSSDTATHAPVSLVFPKDNWSANWPARRRPDSIDNDGENVDNCTFCGGGGKLLCCDTCQNAFHFKCIKSPNKTSLKDDEWFCPKCDTKHEFTFTILDGKVVPRNEFNPPTEIKEYFEGVGEAFQYDPDHPSDLNNQRYYQPVPHIPRLTKPAKPGTLTPAYNDPNLIKLMENGHVILCTKCGRSSDNERPIIRCDYCTCRFHLDCLDPPRACPPNPANPHGWMCPNHVTPEDMIAKKVVNGQVQERRVRRPRNLLLIDAEPMTTYDKDSTFDEDWRGDRLRFPPGDLIQDFVSAVKEDRKKLNDDYIDRMTKRMVAVTTMAIKDLAARNGGIPSQAWFNSFESLCKTEARRIRRFERPDEEADAAHCLLNLATSAPAQSSPLDNSQSEQTVEDSKSPLEAKEKSPATETV
ncbi:hypothetical protein N7520_007767, partial [Penicillium odoratum]|uniref:uncharacterized protein n=1 Tax=Penicillium odoratum TaxID=1167516 RepID=UPI00254829CE